MRRRLGSERGMTLVEVTVAMVVILVGALATMATYAHFSSASNTARERALLVSVAQREMEELKPLGYDQLGLTAAPGSTAADEAPLIGAAAGENKVIGGVVSPGPEAFSYRGATGRIYRYVTWRSQSCDALTLKLRSQLSTLLGSTTAELEAAIADICPAESQTKRVTIVAVADGRNGKAPSSGVYTSTIREDPEMVALDGLADGLAVDAVNPLATPAPSGPEISTQSLYLTDTRCTHATRQTPFSHVKDDTSQQGFTCAPTGPAPVLMTLDGNLGPSSAPLQDFSTDVLRPLAPNGLALRKDNGAGACDSGNNLVYSNSEKPERARGIHTWASKPLAAAAETPLSGGRASLTLYTSTTSGSASSARLCVTLRRASDGLVLGSSDFQLASWPGQITQLVTAFELGHTTLAPGERLLLTLRVPSDSGSGLRIMYDHAEHPSNLAITTLVGKELK